jgi:hypothetical protein
MPDHLAQYRQAIADSNPDRAQVVLTSAIAAARAGAITPEDVAALAEEAKTNPPA